MKKVLSLFLAVLMLCSCLSVSSLAAEGSYSDSIWWTDPGRLAQDDQVVLQFDSNGGTFQDNLDIYDNVSGEFVTTANYSGIYVMLPRSTSTMKEKSTVTLPRVDAPKGYKFDGWYCYEGHSSVLRQYYGAAPFYIPEGAAGTVLKFQAAYSPTQVEEDTMAKVMSILFKVFGTILGILLYGGDSDAGIAVMEKIFGNMF